MINRVTQVIELGLPHGEPTEHLNGGESWQMRARGVRIQYVWDRGWGFWRVMQSTIFGTPVSGPCPDEYTYVRQDRNKPLWLVALELQHYPRQMETRNGTR